MTDDRVCIDMSHYEWKFGVGSQRAHISLKSAWARKKQTLSLADVIVAATSLEHELTLMTDSRNDFPLPELKLYPLL